MIQTKCQMNDVLMEISIIKNGQYTVYFDLDEMIFHVVFLLIFYNYFWKPSISLHTILVQV